MAVSPAMPGVGEIVKIDVEGSPTRRDRADGQPQRSPTPETLVADRPRFDRAVLAFVALGVVLRVGHYLSNYPLWGDEAFLAINFLRRGYLDLLLPLDYGQICPILFLWAELTAVKLFGFSEMSLRLCPLICGVASVFLFRHVAVRLLKGPAVLMAVAIFAVSIHPIRHSADVKPYASDLLMALTFLAFAIEWFVSPERTGWLWTLAGFVPFALAASYPAVFVATGIALALAASVWRTRAAGAETCPGNLRFGCGDDVRGPVRRVCAPPAWCVAAGDPELLGRFLPPARLGRTACELADHDARRQYVRLSRRGRAGGEQWDADSGAHRCGCALAAGPRDDTCPPGHADGHRTCGRGAQAVSHTVASPGSCSISPRQSA